MESDVVARSCQPPRVFGSIKVNKLPGDASADDGAHGWTDVYKSARIRREQAQADKMRCSVKMRFYVTMRVDATKSGSIECMNIAD